MTAQRIRLGFVFLKKSSAFYCRKPGPVPSPSVVHFETGAFNRFDLPSFIEVEPECSLGNPFRTERAEISFTDAQQVKISLRFKDPREALYI